MATVAAPTSKTTAEVPMLVGGRLEPSSSTRFGDVFNPSTGKVQARVPHCTTDEVERVVKIAAEALPAWAETPVVERARVMFRFRERLHARFEELASAYERLKRRRGVVDFDDLLVLNLRAMQTDEAFRSLVRWRFRHLFVDEAQDINPLQHALLEEWRGGRPDICLVGDPRQAIYGWNGSDHTTMSEVERVYFTYRPAVFLRENP